MTKPMISHWKFGTVPQTSNLRNAAAPASIEQAAPPSRPARSAAPATPRGASPRQSLSPSLRPHAALSGLIEASQ